MHDASHLPEVVQEEPILSPADRRTINRGLAKRRSDLACGVLFPNPRSPGAEKPRGRVIVVSLGRGTTGKPPRRGVHVPLSSHKAIVANTVIHGRAVVNPRHQKPYIKRRMR